jgi:hypothetical protein
VEFNVGVFGDRDLILLDGELLVRRAGEAWSRAGRHLTLDNFATKGTLAQRITFAEAVGTLKS